MKKKNYEKIYDSDRVNLKTCGKNTTVTKCYKKNTQARIKKIDKDRYINLSTGEVKNFKHYKNRSDGLLSLKKSMSRLIDLINCNTDEPKKCLFVTLTYNIDMKDKKQVSKDFKAFITSLNSKKYKNKFHFNNVEYIAVYEIQVRNTYHIHALLIFDNPNITFYNTCINQIWGKGFTSTKKLYQDCDDFGRYFAASFSDISLCEARRANVKVSKYKNQTVEKTLIGPRNGKKIKKFIKGLRFEFMDPCQKFYSCSRGIKRPVESKDIPYIATKTVTKNKDLKSAITFDITNENGVIVNRITKEKYR